VRKTDNLHMGPPGPSYITSAWTEEKTSLPRIPLLLRFNAPLPNTGRIENTASFIVACLFVADGMCLPRRCLAMAAYIRLTIQAFSHHVSICYS
jgi:hypothetical protein